SPLQEPTGEPVPKRPRGRPKGSKNKGPSKAAQKKAETTGEKRPRGRPRKWRQAVKSATRITAGRYGENEPFVACRLCVLMDFSLADRKSEAFRGP
ncbi:hypothetical protein PO909_028917, partial [Leuciscus waleckii]